MAGVTPNGIHYPDGASKAKNLGPELQQMAEDIDTYIGSYLTPDGPIRQIVIDIAEVVVDDLVPPAVEQAVDDLDLVQAHGPDGRTRLMSVGGHVIWEGTEHGTFNAAKSDHGAYVTSRSRHALRGGDDRRTRIIDPETGRVAFEVDETGAAHLHRLFLAGNEISGTGGGIAISRVKFLVLLGQSNMMGIAWPYGGQPDPTHPRRLMYDWNSGSLVTASTPLSSQSPENTAYGIGDEVSRLFMRDAGEDTAVVVLNAAVGGTSILTSNDTVNGNWALDYTGQRPHLTTIAKNAITQVQSQLAARYPAAAIEPAIFWHQGEANAANPTGYETMYRALISEFRTHLGDQTVPWVSGGVVPGNGPMPGRETIRQAFITTAADLEHVAHVDGIDNGGGSRGPDDEVHYTRAAAKRIAADYLDGWERAAYATAESAPQRPLDVTATRVGNEVTVTWSPPICRFTGFTVEWSTDQVAWSTVPRTVAADRSETFTATGAGTSPVYVRVTTVNSTATDPAASPTTPVMALRG